MTNYTSTYSELSTPEWTNSGSQQVTVTGRIQPAAAGRPVSLRRVNSDGTTTWITQDTTDADGRFSITTTVTVITTFRLWSEPQTVGADTYAGAKSSDFTVKSLRLWDTFTYANVAEMQNSGKWTLRQPGYGTDGRTHQSSSWDAISFTGTQMVFNIVADGVYTDGKPKYKVPHISAGTLKDIVRGHAEARIKFPRPQGAHGALWWQCGYADGGGEFDVVEFFGERKADTSGVETQKVQHTVYKTPSVSATFETWTATDPNPDPNHYVHFDDTDNASWWDQFHVFHGFWNSDMYRFYIDDVLVGTIGPAQGIDPATVPGEVILSLLISDWEYDTLQGYLAGGGNLSDYRMYVDWIRVWR